MSFFKRHLLFSSILGLILVGTLVLGWFVYSSWSRASAARQTVLQKQGELQRYLSLPVYPNRENAERVRREMAASRQALEAMFKLLESTDQTTGVFPEPPTSRTEAYFSLTRFVEEFRERADAAGVVIRPDERFGFSQFANQGPEVVHIPRVFRQRYLGELILTALFKASPASLTEFQRQVVVTAPAEGQAFPEGGQSGAGGGPDTFVIPTEISARREGFIDTIAFRVQFNGYTNSLRSFLNELANSPFPIVVRAVEVAPLGGAQDANRQAEPVRRAPTPASPFGGGSPFDGPSLDELVPVEERPIQIISQNESSFTVVLEYIELITDPAEAAESPESTEAAGQNQASEEVVNP